MTADALINEIMVLVDDYYIRASDSVFHPGVDVIPIGMPIYGSAEVKSVIRALLSGWISMGKRTEAFERAFASYVGARGAVAVNSGSSANLLALASLIDEKRLVRGQEVILPAATFATVLSPVLQLGLRPVVVDVEPDTFNISVAEIDAAIGPSTGAIIMVHTLGAAADVDGIRALAKTRDLAVIEDCCEAHGTRYKGQVVGVFGDVSTSSFYVAHNMTTGEGGMVITSDGAIERAARSLREFGRLQGQHDTHYGYTDARLSNYDERFVFERVGYNLRMTDIVASFGLEQLKKLDTMNASRVGTASAYSEHLRKYEEFLQLPAIAPQTTHTFYAYPVVVRPDSPFGRLDLARFLESRKIETRAVFGGCLVDQPAYRGLDLRVVGDLPVSRHLRDHGLMIGCHPGISEAQREYVCSSLDDFFASTLG